MKAIKFITFFVSAYIIQVAVVSRLTIFGTHPNMLLIITTLFAVSLGAEQGFIMGMLFGVTQDIFGTGSLLNTVSYGLLGFLIGTLKESVLGTEEGVALTAVVAATVTNYFIELVLLFFFFGYPVGSFSALVIMLLMSCLLNTLFTPLLYPAVKYSSKFLFV